MAGIHSLEPATHNVLPGSERVKVKKDTNNFLGQIMFEIEVDQGRPVLFQGVDFFLSFVR